MVGGNRSPWFSCLVKYLGEGKESSYCVFICLSPEQSKLICWGQLRPVVEVCRFYSKLASHGPDLQSLVKKDPIQKLSMAIRPGTGTKVIYFLVSYLPRSRPAKLLQRKKDAWLFHPFSGVLSVISIALYSPSPEKELHVYLFRARMLGYFVFIYLTSRFKAYLLSQRPFAHSVGGGCCLLFQKFTHYAVPPPCRSPGGAPSPPPPSLRAW